MKKSPPYRNGSSLIMDHSRAKGGLPFGEHRTHIVIRERESYLVPIIAKAIEISEHLRASDSGLRVKDIRGLTGYSLSTIYRILRTLLAFGYVGRDLSGYYKLHRFAPLNETDSSTKPKKNFQPCIAD
jgi:IclR helix-turn-helix domain